LAELKKAKERKENASLAPTYPPEKKKSGSDIRPSTYQQLTTPSSSSCIIPKSTEPSDHESQETEENESTTKKLVAQNPTLNRALTPVQLKGHPCGRCGKSIGMGAYLEACDKKWHMDCFLCKMCDGPLTGSRARNRGQFYQIEQQPYCLACSHKYYNQ